MRSFVAVSLLAVSGSAFAKGVPSPKDFLGADVCSDYTLFNYRQLVDYWKELERSSDRIKVVSIGKTDEGREQYMCIITDPSNMRNLEAIRKGNERLARARDFKSDSEARELARKQKAVVWIDGGLHATETLESQHLIEQAYQLVSRTDEENNRILRDCVILLVHANPDGHDLVADWYMRKENPTERSLSNVPVLYQKYAGHDNNRDFYANNLAETRNMNHVLYWQWYPQIVYNHHQSAPAGTIMFIPPFRNPFNYNMDPIVEIGTDLVGTHMHRRLIAEGYPGTAMRNSTLYSTWWNGGLRTTTYFHNMIGILTETFGTPTPSNVPFVEKFQIPSTDVPFPVTAGRWHFRQSLAYEITANYAILDYASRYRERLLFDFYKAGRNSIERGNKDTWSRYPSRIAEHKERALDKPELRDARTYVLPVQEDMFSVNEFLNRLLWTGVEIEQLEEDLVLEGKMAFDQWGKPYSNKIPKGSYIIRTAQAFRPHVLDMFEPQDHPNDFQYPGGPPIPPYDNAGYTLAFQMGVDFVRVLDETQFKAKPVKGLLETKSDDSDLSRGSLAAYREVNAALNKGEAVWANQNGFSKTGSSGVPLKKPRIALWDRYGGSMESGWTRWVLERFGFEYEVVFAPDLNWGNLREKYDCIILPNGAIPAAAAGRGSTAGAGGETGNQTFEELEAFLQGGGQQTNLADDPTVPYFYRRRIGNVTNTTVAKLREFAEQGGHLICIGSSAMNLARRLNLPVENALVDEKGEAFPRAKFYVPGSILRMQLKQDSPLVGGYSRSEVDVFYNNSPAFKVKTPAEGSIAGKPEIVGSFSQEKLLRSGWAWGQELLKDSAAIVDVPYGKGKVVLYGPEVMFRAQPFGTFRLVFNAIYRSSEQR